MAIDGIPVFDRSVLINSPSLGMRLAKTMGKSKACMMHGHGVTTAGPSVEQAALYMIQLNDLATINYHAQLLGGAKPISKEDQDIISNSRPKVTGVADGSPPKGAEAALWKYYCRVTQPAEG